MKRLLVIFLTLVITAFLTSCSNDGIKFVVRFSGRDGFGMDRDTLAFCFSERITSKEELIMLSQKMQNGIFDEQSDSYDSEVGKIIRSYDETFFENNNLIICVIESGYGYSNKIKKLDIDDNKLIVHINKKRKKGTHINVAFTYLFLLEVNKEDVSNVDYVETKFE